MSRMRSLPAGVLAVALLGAGCGGGEASVVEAALDTPIKSAQVALRVRVDQGGAELARVTMRGPVRSNGADRLESFDWRVRIAGAGQRPIAARVISTGSNVFVRYSRATYEVGERRIARLNRRAAGGGDVGDLSRLGIDLKTWFPESAGEPLDSEVDGVRTRKVTGRLDVSAALEQLAPLLKRPEVRARLGGRVPALSPRAIRAIDAMITDPRFELEAGRDDGKLRRVAARFRIRDPRGSEEAGVRFALRLSAVDEPVRIDAPASGRPVGRLLERLGLGGALRREARQTA